MTGEASGVEEQIHDEASGVEEGSHAKGRDLTDEERFGVYFALTVIKHKDGQVLKKDKELVASLMDTSLSTVDRIWRRANQQIEQGEEVDV